MADPDEQQQQHAAVILAETGREDLNDAIHWLAEGHPMPPETHWTRLLRALVNHVDADEDVGASALRRVTREAAKSDVDTARVLFDAGSLTGSAEFADALEELISRSDDGTLGGLTARGVLRAQHANSLAIETLCLTAGVSYGDAKEWFGPSGDVWSPGQVEALVEYLNQLVGGEIRSMIPESKAARAIELIETPEGGWALLEKLRTDGVPFELLLAQRSAGGVWLQHKNRTSSHANIAVAEFLCECLESAGVDFRRSSTLGGVARQRDLQEFSGVADKRVGVVAVDSRGKPSFVVAFSAARDGGTARANGDGLLQIPRTSLPFAVVLTGLGWTKRPETDRLAVRFDGMIFTERSIDDLVDCISELST